MRCRPELTAAVIYQSLPIETFVQSAELCQRLVAIHSPTKLLD